MEKVLEIIKGIKRFVEEKEFVVRHRTGETAFTRVKKIKFADIVLYWVR